MFPLGLRTNVRRVLRLIGIAAAISLGVTALVVLDYWLEDHSRATIWHVKLICLIALEFGYGLLAVGFGLLSPVLGFFLYRGLRQPHRRLASARCLLLCVSLLLAFALAEGTAAMWWQRTHQFSALPIGGRRETTVTDKQAGLPATAKNLEIPVNFPEKTDESVDLVVVGESSAAGAPYDWWLSLGQIVSWQLDELIPGQRFRHEIVATPGDTLERQYQKLASKKVRPDVLIIYAGHNEFSARFPWSREVRYYHDSSLPGVGELIVQQAEASSSFCRLIREEIDKCRVALPPPPGGYRNLVDEPAYTEPELAILVSDFERHLDALVSYAERCKALPILIAPAANDSGFEPSRSYLPSPTTRAERASFTDEFLAARRLEASDPEGGIKRYEFLLGRQPGFAELHYRLARLLQRSGRWDEAYQHDVAARDLDGLPLRCLTRFQDVYRIVATRHHCPLIDTQRYFHRIGLHGLLDDHLFHDGLHPSLRGQLALAQAVLAVLHGRKLFGWPDTVPVPVLDPARCARHFGLTPFAWQEVCNFGIMFYESTAGTRYDPSERLAKGRAFGAALERIGRSEEPEAVGLPNIGLPEPVPLVPEALLLP